MKKKTLVSSVVAMACVAFAQDQSLLSGARAKIGEAIADPSVMMSTMQGLSATDQVTYLADVNAAIAEMPGQSETRAAAFLDANRAALKASAKGNLTALLAQVFATVPLDALTILNESLAADLFNRSADPSVTYTDEQFTKLAKTTVGEIAKSLAEVDNGAVRTGFAILMFTRASNGSPVGLADTLAAALPEASQEVARKEWFPAALATGDGKSYDSMLGDGDYGTLPNESVVLRLAHPQSLSALLIDLASGRFTDGFLAAERKAPYGEDRGGIGAGLGGVYQEPGGYPGQD